MAESEHKDTPGEALDADSAPQAPADAGPQATTPEEEELRRQLEEEIRKVRMQDVVAQSLVSVLNLAGRRLLKEDERDLEQARLGIEAARAWVELIEPSLAGQVRQAISELQVHYAKLAGGEGAVPAGGEGAVPAEASGGGQPPPQSPPQVPRRPPPGLWTPHGSD